MKKHLPAKEPRNENPLIALYLFGVENVPSTIGSAEIIDGVKGQRIEYLQWFFVPSQRPSIHLLHFGLTYNTLFCIEEAEDY